MFEGRRSYEGPQRDNLIRVNQPQEENPKMTADLQDQAYVNEAVLYIALELSNAKWRLAFGDGTRQRQVVIVSGDVASLSEQIAQVKAQWGLSLETPVVSC